VRGPDRRDLTDKIGEEFIAGARGINTRGERREKYWGDGTKKKEKGEVPEVAQFLDKRIESHSMFGTVTWSSF